MKTLTFDEIVKRVRAKLDEIGMNESEMMDTDIDNANVDAVIKSNIPEAYRFVTLYADSEMLEGKDGSSTSISVGDDMVARVSVPKDFLRLLAIRLSSWNSSCSELVRESSTEYRIASNKWTGGSQYKPVAALVNGSTGRSIELFKAASKDDKLAFTYIPTLEDSATSVDISEQTVNAFIYYVAALTLKAFREEISDSYFVVARNLLGIV